MFNKTKLYFFNKEKPNQNEDHEEISKLYKDIEKAVVKRTENDINNGINPAEVFKENYDRIYQDLQKGKTVEKEEEKETDIKNPPKSFLYYSGRPTGKDHQEISKKKNEKYKLTK